MNNEVAYIATSEAQIAATQSVLEFLGADACRFVFRRLKNASMQTWKDRETLRNAGSMLYLLEYRIDWAEPRWTNIPDVKAFAPLFDPAGDRIVYSVTFMPSDIYALELDSQKSTRIAAGAHPHWWIDPVSGARYVVYRTENGLYTGFPRGRTIRQRVDEVNKPVGAPVELSPYGFGGGITPDGRFLATGFSHLIVADLSTGEYLQGLGERQLPDGENQVCDVSVSPDDSQRVMHLRLTEKGEGRHDFFGFCHFDGSEYVKVSKPEGTQEWQTPEWSTHPNFATAVATREDNTYDIYIVRLSDLALLRLTRDGGYGHVHLWVSGE